MDLPGWRPRGRDSTCAPRDWSSWTRNSDIWGERGGGGQLVLMDESGGEGGRAAYSDDVWTALIFGGDGGDRDGLAETFYERF